MFDLSQFYSAISNVQEQAFSLIGPILVYARFIGAIGALILTVKTYSKLQTGQNGYQAIMKFSHVFIIALALWSYPAIMGFVNTIFNSMNRDLMELSEGRSGSYLYVQQKREINERLGKNSGNKKILMEVAEQGTYGEIEGYLDEHPELASLKVKDKNNAEITVSEFMKQVKNNQTASKIETYWASILENTIFFFARLVLGILLMVRAFVLSILYLLGPLAIGFFLIPGFEGSLVHWAQKYIHVSLWCVVAFVLELILHKIGELDYVASVNGEDAGVIEGIGLVSIFGYFMIPTMAMWLVQGVTTNFAGKFMSLARGAKKAGRIATDVATGGATAGLNATFAVAEKAGQQAAKGATNTMKGSGDKIR